MTTAETLKRICDAFFLVAQSDQYGMEMCDFMSLVECELYGTEYDTEDTDGFVLRAFDIVKPYIEEAKKADEKQRKKVKPNDVRQDF